MKKYLFICAMGINRSPTAARVAKEIAQENKLELEVSYGGYCSLIKIQTAKEYLDSYDLIVVMEDYMEEGLRSIGIEKSKIRSLMIPDEYTQDDSSLIKILKSCLPQFVRENPL